jgi:serine/threonine protein phosphatase PrpC
MPSSPILEFAGITDVGRVREKNEDAIAINEELKFALLADGMGGYNAGEVASEMAVSGIKEILEKGLRRSRFSFFRKRSGDYVRELLTEAIAEVNQRIYQKARSDPSYYGMGTTLSAIVFHGKRITIAHIGDSRIYRFRNGELVQLTRDHTWVQDQVDAGWMTRQEAQVSEYKSLLTRALGVYEEVSADINDHGTLPGDLYLLCSDGLTDTVSERKITAIVRAADASNPQAMCRHLVDIANEAGGFDNISVVAARSYATTKDPN